jgi:hypothetical protein
MTITSGRIVHTSCAKPIRLEHVSASFDRFAGENAYAWVSDLPTRTCTCSWGGGSAIQRSVGPSVMLSPQAAGIGTHAEQATRLKG